MHKEYEAKVLRVIDGDTVEVSINFGFGINYVSKLRFLSYDSPETFRPSCDEERIAGEQAKEYLHDRLHAVNWQCTLRTYKRKKGKYGRILARIFLGEEDLIQTMKDLGMVKLPEWKK